MTRLIIWRHGRTEWNATGRFQGQADVDLDSVGEAEAARTAPGIAAHRPDLIISSDLRRATRTAEVLAAAAEIRVEADARLRERYFGPWQGLTLVEVEQRFPAEHARWAAGLPISDPAIETVDDLAKRVMSALRDAAERAGGGTVVVVTHGGAARVGVGGLLGWPSAVWPTLGVLANCHHARLRHVTARGWRLQAYNVA